MLEFVNLLPWFIKFARLNNDYLGMQNPLRRMERPGLCKYLEFTNIYINIFKYIYKPQIAEHLASCILLEYKLNLRLENGGLGGV